MSTPTASDSFRVMGTTARVWVRARHADDLVAHARAELADLEMRWSRFRPESELSAINARDDCLCAVSEPTYEVLRLAYSAWNATAGAFDPTVHDALVALGYDRTFAEVAAGTAAPAATPPVPGLAGMRFLPGHYVAIPKGVHLDLGGIGKGYAADRVATQLHQLGARGASVDLGGDMRCVGEYAPRTRWVLDIDDPNGDGPIARVAFARGAVASSWCTGRTWRAGDEHVHHIVDPRTGRSARTGIAGVTVVDGEAWRAEVVAKAVLVLGVTVGIALVEGIGAAAIVVGRDGAITRSHHAAAFAA